MKKIKAFAVFMTVAIMLCALCVSVIAEVNPVPETSNSYSLRLTGERGIRVKAGIDTDTARDEMTTEFGFIVTRKVFLDNNNISVEDFCLDSNVKKVTNCAKKTVDGESIENFFDVNDETTYFTGVFTGIDEDHFDEVLVSKPYVIYNNEIYYGKAAEASYVQVAESYQKNEEVFNLLSYADRRSIDDIVRRAGGFTKEVTENLIIPTDLNGTKPMRSIYDEETDEYTYYMYAFVDDEAKYVPVDKEYYNFNEGFGWSYSIYDAICSYRVRNGLYCITPLAYITDAEGNYIGIEKKDISLLDYKNPERTFYADLWPDGYPSYQDGMFDFKEYNVERKLEYLEGHSKIVVRASSGSQFDGDYRNYICSYTKEEFDKIDFSSLCMNEAKCVISNNIDSTESEYIDVLYLVVEGDSFEDKTPVYPVPEIKVGKDAKFLIANQRQSWENTPRKKFNEKLMDDFWHIVVYSEDVRGYVPVNTQKVLPKVIDFEWDGIEPIINQNYNYKLSAYAVDENGIYHIKPLGYDLDDVTGEYNGVEKEDITVLDGDDADALFYTEITNARFYRDNGFNFAVGIGRKVNIENAKIFVTEHIIDEENGIYEDRTFSVSYEDMKTMHGSASRISLLIQNNPQSNEVETLVAAYIQTDRFEYETCENLGHDYIVLDKKDPDCINDGYIRYACDRIECTDRYKTETLPATGHDHRLSQADSRQPTCSVKGVNVYRCRNEGCTSYHIEEVPAKGHTFGGWITEREPTCTESGLQFTQCSACGAVENKVIKALGHDYKIIESLEPTCFDDGYAKLKCSRDGCGHEKRQHLESKGHSFGDDNICDVCGEIVEIHEHDYSKITYVKETCTTTGYTQYTCESCGEFYRDNYVEPLGHLLKEGAISVPATCTTSGRQKFICNREGCGITEDRIIPASHNWSTVVSVEPTCNSDGEATKTCVTCGETQTEIVKAYHKWDEGQIIKQPDCENEGEKSCFCSACKETQIFKIPASGHQYKNGYCTVCGDYFMDNIVYLEESKRYGMYFSIDDIVSAYGPELVDEYGVYLDHNEDAKINKVAVYLTQLGTMWMRTIAVTGTDITKATYVPYLAYNGELSYTGLNHGWINTFRLTKDKDGIYSHGLIGVNLEDSEGNLLLTLSDIGRAGYQTRIFDNLTEMREWLMEGACEHNWKDSGFEIEPTCTKGGVKIQTCLACGETQTVGVAALGHNMGGWFTVQEPTFEEEGLERRECKNNCGHFEERAVDKLEPEKFEPAELMFIVPDKRGAGMTSTVLKYCDTTGKDEHYLECYIDGELVQIPINPDLFYPSIEDCYDEYDEAYYIGDARSNGTYTYVEKLATATLGSDGRYVIKPVLHLENKNGDYIGVNRSTEGIFDNSEMLFGNDLGSAYTGFLNRFADGSVMIAEKKSGTTLVGDIDGGVMLDHLNITDDTRIIIKDRADGTYREFTKDNPLTSSVATEITNIQYVVTNANDADSSADLLALYAETSNFEYKTRYVTYKIEANGDTSFEEVRDCSTLTLQEGPTVKNWIFTGWEINGEQYMPGDVITVTSDIVITGKYARALIVTIVKSCCNVRETIECASGEVITLPEAHACDGYRFDNWKITATGMSAVTKNPGDKYTVTSNATVTSVTTRLYEVTYNFSCCGETDVIEVANGTKLTLAKPEHLCDGYVFSNFAIADRSGNPKEYKVGDTVTISKNTSVDVVYKKLHKVTVYEYEETYKGLEISGQTVYEVVDGEYFELPEYPVFENYRVDRWYVSDSGQSEFREEFEKININRDTEVMLLPDCYTKIVNIKLICRINGDEEYTLQYEEGEVITLGNLHPDSLHKHDWDEWWFDVDGVPYSDACDIVVKDGMEIICYGINYPRYTVKVHHVFDDVETQTDEHVLVDVSNGGGEAPSFVIPEPVNDDYFIFNGWFVYEDGETPVDIGDIIYVPYDIDVYGYYTHVPEYDPEDPEAELPEEVIDPELLAKVSQAREEIIDIRMSNSMHTQTKQEIIDTVKLIMNDIYEGLEVDPEYVKEVYQENIDSIKKKIKEEMNETERSTFANIMLGGISDDVKTFLSDNFGIDLDNIEI